jgi:uncharacterized protein with PQ loop repeat
LVSGSYEPCERTDDQSGDHESDHVDSSLVAKKSVLAIYPSGENGNPRCRGRTSVVDLAGVFGGIGTVIGLVRALPQLLRLARSGDAHGVSLDAAATSSIVSFGWATYGILTDQLPILLGTGSSGVIFLGVSFVAVALGRGLRELRMAPLWLLVMVGFGGIGGSDGLGLILPVSVLAGNLPQVVTAFRERDLTGLSLSTWIFSFSDGLVWEAYALAAGDFSVAVFGILQMVTSGAIVLRRWTWSRGNRRVPITASME